ncbi:hypothetical protein DF3PA_90018 [Candidatus Defluviicoccus seviourii]|uniref:Uncharacterized protein n=1 Tax=Candidatus Defluviicoccus seviourii TaxID=2565273 RepID=A0A564WI23_9PROT|nr:hypothetical protein DF3PA_90018 [Candidatus Defluviicoccus seviourii]
MPSLLKLRLFKDDVLARYGIVLAELKLLRRGARILFRYVEIAGAGAARQLDQDRRRLRHRARDSERLRKRRRSVAAAGTEVKAGPSP